MKISDIKTNSIGVFSDCQLSRIQKTNRRYAYYHYTVSDFWRFRQHFYHTKYYFFLSISNTINISYHLTFHYIISEYQNFIEYVDDSWVKGMWWFYIIGLIWTSEFILACQQMTIAGAVSHWYFRYVLHIYIFQFLYLIFINLSFIEVHKLIVPPFCILQKICSNITLDRLQKARS